MLIGFTGFEKKANGGIKKHKKLQKILGKAYFTV